MNIKIVQKIIELRIGLLSVAPMNARSVQPHKPVMGQRIAQALSNAASLSPRVRAAKTRATVSVQSHSATSTASVLPTRSA